ncbi:MAG: carbohydrate kinase family protein [Streptosporangiaceae bacterium]
MTGDPAEPATITVIGEALIDLVPGGPPGTFRALPGGSPYNVAIGLVRLGQRAALMARLADNTFGRLLRDKAAAEGIDLAAAPRATEPTTLAVVNLDADASASYDFYFEGTADWQWTGAEIAAVPASTAVLHFGSLASWTPPGDALILGLAGRLREGGRVLISYDPNVRPSLLTDLVRARSQIEAAVTVAHLAKASGDDIAYLYPGRTAAEVAAHWLGLGATLVVITGSASGAEAFAASGAVVGRPARPVAVADTVGAGDSFTAGLLDSLVRQDLHDPAALAAAQAGPLAGALDDAIMVASLNCQRQGNDPPTLAEVRSAFRPG